MNSAQNEVSPASAAGALPGSAALAFDTALVLNAIPAGVYSVDLDGRATLLNDAATRMLGWTAADLYGRRLHDIVHHTRADGSRYPASECPVFLTLKDGRPRHAAREIYWRKDGTSLPIEIDVHPINRDGALAGALVTFRDLTEREQGEERSRQLIHEQVTRARAELQHAVLRDVLAQAPALICVTRGPHHVIETVNQEFVRATTAPDVVGRSMVESFPETSPEHMAMLNEAFETGEARVGQEVASALFGSGATERFYNFVVQPLRDEVGTIYGLLIHAVDVTERRRAADALRGSERNLRRRAEELSRVAQALRRSNAELDAFAYAASHDLRAPLRGIANLAQWIEEDLQDRLSDETREMLALMRSRMHRMEALIEGLLEYSRAGRLHHRPARIDTSRLVRDVVDLLSPPESVTVAIGADMPVISGERLPLQQIFLNLIGNAIKHAKRADAQVVVAVREVGRFYSFSVSDNGPGIAPEYHDRIWGIFQTLDARDQVEGTGIGLALVKKLVEAQGGRVGVQSAPGQGATFSFDWPKSAAARNTEGAWKKR